MHGIYDDHVCKPAWVSVEKEGYVAYSTGFRPKYVMQRQFNAQEVEQIAQLRGDAQLRQLRELMAGNWDQFTDVLFRYDNRVLPSLRGLAHEPEVTVPARQILSLIADPNDLLLILQLPSPPGEEP